MLLGVVGCFMYRIFPETWSGCDLIVGTSFGVPIKRGAVEAVGAATPIGKGKEKRIK